MNVNRLKQMKEYVSKIQRGGDLAFDNLSKDEQANYYAMLNIINGRSGNQLPKVRIQGERFGSIMAEQGRQADCRSLSQLLETETKVAHDALTLAEEAASNHTGFGLIFRRAGQVVAWVEAVLKPKVKDEERYVDMHDRIVEIELQTKGQLTDPEYSAVFNYTAGVIMAFGGTGFAIRANDEVLAKWLEKKGASHKRGLYTFKFPKTGR